MIKISDVTKKYGDRVILEHCSYTFPSVGVVCLMGPSGGGKTTLLNLLAGFDTDYTGEILVGGTALGQMDAQALCRYRRDNIGFVFQNYHLLPGYTALENVQLAAELSPDSPKAKREKAVALLTRLGMAEKCGQPVETLSGGQKQRVAIARALMGDPRIIFADEPTGALDRGTSNEIMGLLREISKERLVVVITHDAKISAFADEILHIREGAIVGESTGIGNDPGGMKLADAPFAKASMLARAVQNFRVHGRRYGAVSLAISIGMLAFILSLSFGNVIEQGIDGFKEKNTAFNNGYILAADDGTILKILTQDERVENVYYQYKLENIGLSMGEKTQLLSEKFPTPKATESLSYGVMPRRGQNEIAITPSLAKKFDADIENLLGKELTLTWNGENHALTVSGIYNAGYDDFFISADLEQRLYDALPEQANDSISYDVKEFDQVVAVNNSLKLQGIDAKTAADEVYALQSTFADLNKLFLVVSVLILAIGLFLCAILLIKLQNDRYHEVGLLSALGFSQKQIASMICGENLLLSALATAVNLLLLGAGVLVSRVTEFPLLVTGGQILLSVGLTFGAILLISSGASYKLVRTEPAAALRK